VIGGPLALGSRQLTIAGSATLQVVPPDNLSFSNKVKLSGGVATVNLPQISIVTLSGNISGSGALSVTGDGALILSGANTYAGGTTIGSEIALQVGKGGTTGSIKGNVVDHDVLEFARSNTLTFGGAISGSGSVELDGSGEVILTGHSTYSGGTDVIQGTLGVGASNALGTGTVSMQQNTTLAFTTNGIVLPNNIVFANEEDPTIDTGSNNATITGVISGVGALSKTGSGALTLTADETFKGVTTVVAGTLIVDGSLTIRR
jgi:autotransporter-associated beta strand protein